MKWKKGRSSIKKTAEIVNVPKSKVWDVLKKNNKYGGAHNLHRNGRPRKTCDVVDRRIARAVKKNPKRRVTDITVDIQSEGIDISKSTFRRRLKSQDFNGCSPRCKPLISKKNRRNRLDFATKYLNKSATFWKSVLWTDETKVNLYKSDSRHKVRRKTKIADNPRNTTSSVKFGGGNVMAWASMAATGVGSLVFIDDITNDGTSIMNSTTFQEILRANVCQDASKLIGKKFVLQMDNDPKHTPRATKAFLKQKKWKILEWSSQSPNIYLIEHAFNLMKRNLKKSSPRNKEELKKPATEAWKRISSNNIQKLVSSMPRRLQTIIDWKGYATKY